MPDYPVLAESTRQAAGGWVHDKCGTELLGAKVYHPIHDGPFPLSGSGRVEIETVPYCPTCQEKPKEQGAPINVGPTYG
jgi:hypothetical protein